MNRILNDPKAMVEAKYNYGYYVQSLNNKASRDGVGMYIERVQELAITDEDSKIKCMVSEHLLHKSCNSTAIIPCSRQQI